MLEIAWYNPARWPFDPAGYTFLPRAVLRVGTAMYGDGWQGDEPKAQVVEARLLKLPGAPSLAEVIRTQDEFDEARVAMKAWCPDLTATPPHPEGVQVNAFVQRPSAMRQAQWLEVRHHIHEVSGEARNAAIAANLKARAEADAHNGEARPKIERYLSVVREIVRACEAKEVAAVIREQNGGGLLPMRREHWNTEQVGFRFEYGAYDPQTPFKTRGPTSSDQYIFLKTDDLDGLAQRLSIGLPQPAGLPHLSPYMKVMLAVIERANVTKENQPPKSSIEAEIEALWTVEPALSERLLQAMATLIREPESQLGRGRKRI